MHIYTMEELCCYFCNNHMIDYTITNQRLYDWLDDELGLSALADELGTVESGSMRWSSSLLTVLVMHPSIRQRLQRFII